MTRSVRTFEQVQLGTYLANTANVLVARLLIEAEVLIETEANVVTIEAVGELLEVKQMLLKRTSDGRLQQRLCQNHRKLWKVCNDLPFH